MAQSSSLSSGTALMEDDESNKKVPIKLDWNELMPIGKDDDPPPELVVAGDRKRSPPTEAESSEFAGMSDALIEEQINKYKGHLALFRRLPDNGEKLRARIKLLEDERGRRKLRQANDDGCEKLTHSKRQNFTSASGDFMETASSTLRASQSEFGALLNRKLDENPTESRVVNAFESELSYFSHGGNRNARFKGQISTRGRQKSMLSSRQSPFQCPTKLSVDANKSNFSIVDENQHSSSGLSQKGEKLSPDSFMKKKSPSQFLSSKDSRPRNGNTFVLVDEEEPESDPELELIECMEQAEEVDEWFDEGMKDCTINYPSRDDPESVEICYSDLQCLAPQAFVSSTIMNFYIRHLQQPTLATERGSSDYYFFNTYFYSKLTEAISEDAKENSFPRLRRWWKGVDIFRKAYILLPIHESLHWSLVIICIPDKEDCLGPIILHLDSLGLHSSHLIFNNVKSFLREEWKHLNQSEAPYDLPFSDKIWKDLSHRIDEKRIEVPQQRNDYDCGLFVLYFMERFIVGAPQRMKRRDLAVFGRKWFKPEEASNLRQKIKTLLKEEFQKATHDNCASAQSTEVAAQEQKFEQPIDISKFVLVEAD